MVALIDEDAELEPTSHEQPGLSGNTKNSSFVPDIEDPDLSLEQRYAQIWEIIKHRHSDARQEDRKVFFRRMQNLYDAMAKSGESYLDFKSLLDTKPLPTNTKNPMLHPADLLYSLFRNSEEIEKVNGFSFMKSGSGHNGHIVISGNKIEYLNALDDKGVPANFSMNDAYRMVLLAANNRHIKSSNANGMKINGTVRERAMLEKAIYELNDSLPEERRIKVSNPLPPFQYRWNNVFNGSSIKNVTKDDLYITEPLRSFPNEETMSAAAADFAPPQTKPEPATNADPTTESVPNNTPQNNDEAGDFDFDIIEPAEQGFDKSEEENITPKSTNSEPNEAFRLADEERQKQEAIILKEQEFEEMRYDLVMRGKQISESLDINEVKEYAELADDILSTMPDRVRAEGKTVAYRLTDNAEIIEFTPGEDLGIRDTTFYATAEGNVYKILAFKVNGQNFEMEGAHGFFSMLQERKEPTVTKQPDIPEETHSETNDAWRDFTARVESYLDHNATDVLENARQVGITEDGRPVFSYNPPEAEGQPDTLIEYIFVYDENDKAHILRFDQDDHEHIIDTGTPIRYQSANVAPAEYYGPIAEALNIQPDTQNVDVELAQEQTSTPQVSEETLDELAPDMQTINAQDYFAPWHVQVTPAVNFSIDQNTLPTQEVEASYSAELQQTQDIAPEKVTETAIQSPANDEYAWVRDNIIVPFHKQFKGTKIVELVDEINKTLEGRYPALTIANDDLINRLKQDRLIQTTTDKSGEKIQKVATFKKYSDEYKTVVEGLTSNRDVWLNQGYSSFETTIANLRNTTVADLDPIAGPKPWAIWQRLIRDGVISVSGKDKTAVILEVHDGLRNVKHLNLKKDFAMAAAMPPPEKPKTNIDLTEDNISQQKKTAPNSIEVGVKTTAERDDFVRAATGENYDDDDGLMPHTINRLVEERLDAADRLPRYAAE